MFCSVESHEIVLFCKFNDIVQAQYRYYSGYIITKQTMVDSLYLGRVTLFFHLFINIVVYYYYSLDVQPKGSSIENIGYIIIFLSI